MLTNWMALSRSRMFNNECWLDQIFPVDFFGTLLEYDIWRPPPHWALNIERWYLRKDKYGKLKKNTLKVTMFDSKNIPDSQWPVSNIFGLYLRDLLLKIFWARKMFFFFKWVRILPEIDWYHYQGASPSPLCIVRHKILIKTPRS